VYATFCGGCGRWADHTVERGEDAVRIECVDCGHQETRAMRLLPVFIVTGASGVGKSSLIPDLRRLLPEWELFETDILWDSGGDWQFVRQNWLRIAHSIAQSGRPTILCGTLLPEDVDRCDHRELFSQVHYACLHCEPAALATRLRTRPAWPPCEEAFIQEHQVFTRWFQENAATAFDPPLTLIDTTNEPPPITALRVRDWALARWKEAIATTLECQSGPSLPDGWQSEREEASA
jgi:hypothetical protein